MAEEVTSLELDLGRKKLFSKMRSKRYAFLVCYCLCGWLFVRPVVARTFATLCSFGQAKYASGINPEGTLAVDANGILYGTDLAGGAYSQTACGSSGCGVVFSLAPPASPGGSWTETVLWSFGGNAGDGFEPSGGVVIGNEGVLYGTTAGGGALSQGAVFSLTPPASPGGAWAETVLWSFGGIAGDGVVPIQGLTANAGGVLFGATDHGGAHGVGIVFSLTPPSSGKPWVETIIYSPGLTVGRPTAVAIGTDQVIYGATSNSGSTHGGTIFSLTPHGKKWTQQTIWNFPLARRKSPDGEGPNGPLFVAATGQIYGSTDAGGPGHSGTLFRLTPPAAPGGAWTFLRLHSFDGNDGFIPTGGLAALGGTYYGTTEAAGPNGGGTVFSLIP